jgi:hypothetical protein
VTFLEHVVPKMHEPTQTFTSKFAFPCPMSVVN